MKYPELFRHTLEFAERRIAQAEFKQPMTKPGLMGFLSLAQTLGPYKVMALPLFSPVFAKAKSLGIYSAETDEVDIAALHAFAEGFAKSGGRLDAGLIDICPSDIDAWLKYVKESNWPSEQTAAPNTPPSLSTW